MSFCGQMLFLSRERKNTLKHTEKTVKHTKKTLLKRTEIWFEASIAFAFDSPAKEPVTQCFLPATVR